MTGERGERTSDKVAVNIFSNYVHHIAGTVIDFPEVKPGNARAVIRCSCG